MSDGRLMEVERALVDLWWDAGRPTIERDFDFALEWAGSPRATTEAKRLCEEFYALVRAAD